MALTGGRRLWAAAGLFLLTGSAWGGEARWQTISENDRQRVLLAAEPPARTASGTYGVRLKRVFTGEPEERAYALDDLEIDCGVGTYRYTSVVIFDRDDDVMHRYRLTDQFCPVPPGSYLQTVRKLICPEKAEPHAIVRASPLMGEGQGGGESDNVSAKLGSPSPSPPPLKGGEKRILPEPLTKQENHPTHRAGGAVPGR